MNENVDLRAQSGQRGCSSTQPFEPHQPHSSAHAVYVFFHLIAEMFNFLKVVCHLHEIKQVEAVNAEAEGVDAAWMKMLV